VNEEKIERRFHWAQWVITGIIIATGWCVRLEFTVSNLKADMENQKHNRDQMISRIWDRMGEDHDALTRQGMDIQWLKTK
jgi:hypothetical protein